MIHKVKARTAEEARIKVDNKYPDEVITKVSPLKVYSVHTRPRKRMR